MKTLLIVNDALYGSVRTFNGAPLAGALSKQEGRDRRIFHIDAAAAADHVKQKVPAGVYNLEALLSSMVNPPTPLTSAAPAWMQRASLRRALSGACTAARWTS